MLTLKSYLIGVALFFTSVLAWAEEPVKPYPECSHQPTEGDVNGAKGAFQAGQASFNEADYKRAIDYWEDAYRRDCTAHDLLQNLARAYELDNQKRHAVHALETYLARNPSSPSRDQIAKRIEVLNEKIAAEGPAVGTPPAGPTGPGPVTPPPGGDQTPDQAGAGKRPITPLIVAGAGGVLTIVGGLLYLKASGDVSDAEDACGGRDGCPDEIAEKGNSGRSRQRLWGGVTIVGLVAAIGGTVWYLTSKPAPATATTRKVRRKLSGSPSVTPVVGSGFAGLGVSGSF
jgi:hypothetical protein